MSPLDGQRLSMLNNSIATKTPKKTVRARRLRSNAVRPTASAEDEGTFPEDFRRRRQIGIEVSPAKWMFLFSTN
jgi:hypothetical protein